MSTMQFFLHKPFSNSFASDLIPKVNGVFLKYSIGQFFASGGGYNNEIANVRNEINKYPSVGLAIEWGALCGNYIWDNYPYIELIEKHHEGIEQPDQPEAQALYNKFPVPYAIGYLEEVRKFIEYLSIQLAPVIHKIAYIKITAINQQSFEVRIPNQHFATSATTPNEAYKLAFYNWKAFGYTNDKVINAFYVIAGYYNLYFPNTLKIAALIQGTAGFPKIGANGEFNLKPPVINDSLIAYMKGVPGFALMATALTDIAGTPANFVNSGVPMWYQLNNQKMNRTLSKEQFEACIVNGLNHGAEGFELFEINVREHEDVINKYKSY